MRSLNSLPGRRGENLRQRRPHLVEFALLDPVDDEVHHRRLEQEPALDDLDEARHVVVRCRRSLVHLAEDLVGVVGEKGAAADPAADEALALHHLQSRAHRGAAGVELAGDVALVREFRAGHDTAVVDALEKRPVDQRRRRPLVGGNGGERFEVVVEGHEDRTLGCAGSAVFEQRLAQCQPIPRDFEPAPRLLPKVTCLGPEPDPIGPAGLLKVRSEQKRLILVRSRSYTPQSAGGSNRRRGNCRRAAARGAAPMLFGTMEEP